MGGSGSLDQLAPAFGRAWGDGAVIRSLVRDTISLENHLRFGGVTPLADVEGVSFDRWVFIGSPFELPGVGGDPPFGCELSEGGVVDGGAADGIGGSLSIGRGFNVDPRTVGDGLLAAGVAVAPCFVVPAAKVVRSDAGAEDDANGDEDDDGRNDDDDSDEVRGRTGPFPPP
jgi:hypothetical protein